MKCSICGKKATKAITIFIEKLPKNDAGFVSYEKIPQAQKSFFCDDHSFSERVITAADIEMNSIINKLKKEREK